MTRRRKGKVRRRIMHSSSNVKVLKYDEMASAGENILGRRFVRAVVDISGEKPIEVL